MRSKRQKAEKFLTFLDEKYSDAECSLVHKNPFELLIATVLSAQCTDERVNKVTRVLFDKYPDAENMAESDPEEIMEIVRPTGFYKNKASNILRISKTIVEDYEGKLPLDMGKLTKLPGVGRKTANVVLGNFGKAEGIVVDTHVKRVTSRIGIVSSGDPEKIEKELMSLIPHDRWNKFSHQVIAFGRDICRSRTPKCNECGMNKACAYFLNKGGSR
ncbi:MAG: endonuclease III [Flexistipes sinusarabici]|uniref:Endonuclease III n=1 Tax=Flexistipes sinusarabici TaxID=2352 RepID=A0A5D0MHX3_FLESI|nr:endonuclease III [Flexistipes sinusarabici]TYB32576.1 MAG: endonuclease III [Flexistipes sinusarabici]